MQDTTDDIREPVGADGLDGPSARPDRAGVTVAQGAWSGFAAAAVAVALSELLAGLVPGTPSLIVAVGSLVIALQPPGAKDLVATLFGTADKTALNLVVVGAVLVLGAATGVAARRNLGRAATVFALFGALGFVAAVAGEAASPPPALLAALVAASAGLATLALLREVGRAGTPAGDSSDGSSPAAESPFNPVPDPGRRRFLLLSVAVVGAAMLGGGIGRFLLERRHPTGVPGAAGRLPSPALPAPSPPPDVSFPVAGISPIVTPTADFFRIDTALLVPQVDIGAWQLKVTGMVEHPLTLNYEELIAMPLFEQYVTIACVSNSIGGDLVGNARWTGVRLKEILAAAGVAPDATQIVGRSVDGFTVGFPTAWALDPSREPMVALGMNGGPLPAEHGYPARLIVPGLYGYVSATKWLTEIELTTREAFDAYWIPLGWSKDGPILTQSRIDTPTDGAGLHAGRIEIGGVAWAPDRGVSRVEVSIDDGSWQRADAARAISRATWVQWMLAWDATPGQHTIEVRATDGTGEVQTADRTTAAPDGARGHHRITVTVA